MFIIFVFLFIFVMVGLAIWIFDHDQNYIQQKHQKEEDRTRALDELKPLIQKLFAEKVVLFLDEEKGLAEIQLEKWISLPFFIREQTACLLFQFSQIQERKIEILLIREAGFGRQVAAFSKKEYKEFVLPKR